MLDIGPVADAGASYYLRGLTHPRGGAEVTGATVASIWRGAGAQTLGLREEVEADAFTAVLHGRHPINGAPLRRHPVRIQARDCVFRPPKSVSVLAALDIADSEQHLGTPQSALVDRARTWGEPGTVAAAVWRAHHAGVADALAYLEGELVAASLPREEQAQSTGTLPDEAGIVVAAFDHELSRAHDPLVHTHAVMFNIVGIGERRWVPVDSRELSGQRETASYLYHCALRAELSADLGLRWTPTVRGIAEIEGVPWSVRRAFSKRRVAIEEALHRDGRHGATAARIAALRTRAEVGPASPPRELQQEWLQRAHGLGFGQPQRAAVVAFSLATARRGVQAPQSLMLPEAVEEHGALGVRSSFDRRDVLRACALASFPGARAAHVITAADNFLARGDVVDVDPDATVRTRADVLWRRDGNLVTLRTRPRYALAATRERERVVVARALGSDDARVLPQASACDGAGLMEVAGRTERESPAGSQHTVASLAAALRAPGPQVRVVVVTPGSPALSLIDEVRQEWQHAGWEVRGVARGRDVRVLRESTGIETTPVASVRDTPRSRLLSPLGIVVLGAAELEREQLADLAMLVRQRGGQVLLFEDSRLPAYDTSGVLRALRARDPLVLTASGGREQPPIVTRTRTGAERTGAPQADVDGAGAARTRAERKRDELVWESDQGVVLAPSAQGAQAQAIAEWLARRLQPRGAVLVADDSGVRRELNDRARRALQEAGAVGSDGLRVAGTGYAVGDRVRVVRTGIGQRVKRGACGDVLQATTAGLRVRWDGGEVGLVAATLLETRAVEHAYALPSAAAQRQARDAVLLVCAGATVATSSQRGDRRFCVTTLQVEADNDEPARVGGLRELLGMETSHARAVELAGSRRAVLLQPPSPAQRESSVEVVLRLRAAAERLFDVQPACTLPGSSTAPVLDPSLHAVALSYLRDFTQLRDRLSVETEAAEILQPAWVGATLGALPQDPAGRALWRSGLRMVSAARLVWGIHDDAQGLGSEPCQPDRRAQWQHLRHRVEHVRTLSAAVRDRTREMGASIER